MFGHSPFHSN